MKIRLVLTLIWLFNLTTINYGMHPTSGGSAGAGASTTGCVQINKQPLMELQQHLKEADDALYSIDAPAEFLHKPSEEIAQWQKFKYGMEHIIGLAHDKHIASLIAANEPEIMNIRGIIERIIFKMNGILQSLVRHIGETFKAYPTYATVYDDWKKIFEDLKKVNLLQGDFSLTLANRRAELEKSYATYKGSHKNEKEPIITKESLLKKYAPTPEKCGPGIRAINEPPYYKKGIYKNPLPATLEGGIACLLSGNKLFYSGAAYVDQPNLTHELKSIIKANNLDYFFYERATLYVFTPAGRNNVLLLIKSNIDGNASSYLDGNLYGTQDPDILAFYHSLQQPGDPIKLFNEDKTRAEKWLAINRPHLDDWVKQNIIEDTETKTITVKKPKPFSLIEKKLLDEYNPTDDSCRPLKRAEGIGDTILTNSKGVLACILAGKKKVAWIGKSWQTLSQELGKDLIELMQTKKISYIVDRGIMFLSSEKEQAYLLYKFLKEYKEENMQFNEYLVHYLSNVKEEDIKAQYDNHMEYESDKKIAAKWIEDNKSNIALWFEKFGKEVK